MSPSSQSRLDQTVNHLEQLVYIKKCIDHNVVRLVFHNCTFLVKIAYTPLPPSDEQETL